MKTIVALGLLGLLSSTPGLADTVIRVAVLRVDVAGLPPISRLDLPTADLGFAGARLATEDNATTGQLHRTDLSRRQSLRPRPKPQEPRWRTRWRAARSSS